MLLKKKKISRNTPLSAAECCKRGQQELTDDNLSCALEYYQAALEFDNENVEALQGLLSVWQRMGKQQKADEVQKRLDILQPQQLNSSIQNNNRLHPKKWSLKIPTKVSKDKKIIAILVAIAYFGVLFSPLIVVSVERRYNVSGIIPSLVNHIVSFSPCLFWIFKKEPSIKARSFLLGTLIPFPIFTGVLIGLYLQQSSMFILGLDYGLIIAFAVMIFAIDLLLLVTLFVLSQTDFLGVKKWFSSNNWIIVLVCLAFSSFALISLSWLMWQCNVVEFLVNVMGDVIAVICLIIVVIILVIFALATILFS